MMVSELSPFPTPYPDELLFSVLSRYHQRSHNTSHEQTSLELFGGPAKHMISRAFPAGLNYFCQQFPPEALLTPSYFIENHSLLPYYRPFLPSQRVSLALERMENGMKLGRIQTLLGINSSRIQNIRFLRYCSTCFAEDRNNHAIGEAYWHRSHQLPGVFVCHLHGEFLSVSNAPFSNNWGTRGYVPLNDIDKVRSEIKWPEKIRLKNLTLATATNFLLNHHVQPLGPDGLKKRYAWYLEELGLKSSNGRIRQKELVNEFIAFYGSDYLQSLGCEIDLKDSHCWLSDLLRAKRFFSHPLHHLLLIHFLGLPIENLSKNPPQRARPFGFGPWPCLNPVADHFEKKVIKSCAIFVNRNKTIQTGHFVCECGYGYLRFLPEPVSKNYQKSYRVISRGAAWEDELLRLIEKEKLPWRAIGRRLDIDKSNLHRYYEKLLNRQDRNAEEAENHKDKVNVYRKKWLKLRAEHPALSRTEISKMGGKIFKWLVSEDGPWLEKHMPKPVTRMGLKKPKNDWASIDKDLANKVIKAAAEICNLLGKPIRISSRTIGLRIKAPSWLQRHRSKLPLATKALATVVESVEDFQIRRLPWVAAQIRENGQPLTRWRLLRKAGIKEGTLTDSVEKEVERILLN
jgi:hypothetical protein